MIATKRHDYVPIGTIALHPSIENHRPVNREKVLHYKDDILRNGLLEPLVVWERNRGEYFLVGGFHRFNAIGLIRRENPGYFDRVDVRVVAGELEEMRALNLKLNADRLDARLAEYFDTVVFLNNANWSKERIAQFLDRSTTWVEEIVRFVPGMDPRLRQLLDADQVSWSKAKAICKSALAAPPGQERKVVDAALRELQEGPVVLPRRILSPRAATQRLAKHIAEHPKTTYTVSAEDLLALVSLLTGPRDAQDEHLQRVRARFPTLVD
ncbi:MAG: ParB N-terminal domain-containing protein [Planctomycetes bacterium]|nr:ParB-like nuclease domain-containing protein [Planctomycetota bacterium]MCB9885036.1 ParB N-terminal domain-containing protein [Planctomycetota bacterium]